MKEGINKRVESAPTARTCLRYKLLRKFLGAMLPLICCSVFAQTVGTDTEKVFGFPLAPGLKHTGGGHVMGSDQQNRTEITWNAFATDRSVGDVVAYYRGKLGDEGMQGDAHGATWRFPVGT